MTRTVMRLVLALADIRAAEPTVPPGTPWWLAVLLVVVPVIGTVLVARAPVWVEKVKQRGQNNATPAVAAPSPPAVAQAGDRAGAALDLVEQSLRDAWTARDTAIRRTDRLQAELDAEQDKTGKQAVIIAQLEAEIAARRKGAHGDT